MAIIQCDQDLYVALSTHLQHALTGQPIWRSDTLVDLVRRHCPEIYDMARAHGYVFQPSADKTHLEQTPPNIRFDVIRAPAA